MNASLRKKTDILSQNIYKILVDIYKICVILTLGIYYKEGN